MADLAVMTTENATIHPNNTLIKRAKYFWYHKEYDDWSDAVDLVGGRGWRTTHLPLFHDWNADAHWKKNRSILFGGIKGHDGSGIVFLMMRYFLSQHILASDVLDKYDRFVVTRTDHFYNCTHWFTKCDLKDNTIWVPYGQVIKLHWQKLPNL